MGSGGEKPIRMSGHAEGQLAYRGAAWHEVVEAIRTMPWGQAELGRLECRKDYPFHGVWNGVGYSTKQVRPIFVDEPEEIVVVNVYHF